VLELPVRAGDRVPAGALVATIASLDPIAVDIDVAPRFVRGVRAGDVARVGVPSIGVTARAAHVRSIAPAPGDDGQYSIRLLVPNSTRPRLLAGQTAYVTFGGIGRKTR